MRFVSKYRKLVVVVRPARKEIKEVAGDQVVIIHPAIRCEFENGKFDPVEKFDMLSAKSQCCSHHILRDAKQIEFMIKASPGFGSDFTELFEQSPEQIIAQKKQELSELMKQYGLENVEDAELRPTSDQEDDLDTEEEDPNMPSDVNRDGSYKDPDVKIVGEPEFEELKKKDMGKTPPTYKDLQLKFQKKFGFKPMGATYEEIVNALNQKS